MQPQPLMSREIVLLLRHKVSRAQVDGLPRHAAEVVVARQLGLDPVKVAALLDREKAS